MPDSIQDFAAKIKKSHPAYASMDDKELVSKIITKYPQYADNLNTSDVLQLSPQTYAIQKARAAANKPIDQAPADARTAATSSECCGPARSDGRPTRWRPY